MNFKNVLSGLRGSLRLRPAIPASSGVFTEKSPFDEVPPPQGTASAGPTGADPNYYQKLTNLFPAEALAIYGSGVAIFGSANFVVVAVGLIILLVLRTLATQNAAGTRPDWRAVAVAAASYLLWATANDANWLTILDSRLIAKVAVCRKYAAFFGAALVFLAPVLAPEPATAKA